MHLNSSTSRAASILPEAAGYVQLKSKVNLSIIDMVDIFRKEEARPSLVISMSAF